MDPLNLPPLPPVGHRPSSVTTTTNPGTVNPADQGYPPAIGRSDQTRSSTRFASASSVNSNGEQQHVCFDHNSDASNGVTVQITGHGLPTEVHAGSASQTRNLTSVTAQTTSQGLPADVHAGSASHARTLAPIIAKTTNPAVTVQAGTNRPGGLPTNVYVR